MVGDLKQDSRYDWLSDLRGIKLVWAKYVQPREDWDHDHCLGCGQKLMDSECEDAQKLGWMTIAVPLYGDDTEWVCDDCHETFKSEFVWLEPKCEL